MKKILVLLTALLLFAMPYSSAVTTGTSIGMGVNPANAVPEVYLDPDSRTLLEPDGSPLVRDNNYLFEGEQLLGEVLVRDQNGIEDISGVSGTLGAVQGEGNPHEVGCYISGYQPSDETLIPWADNLEFDSDTMRMYNCDFTAEPEANMHGEYFFTVEAEDQSGNQGTYVENEYWFFNPSIGLNIRGTLDFGGILPGETAYSDTIIIENTAEAGSGVKLEMTISGSDFYDPAHSGAKCPTSNVLSLSNFRYFATQGSYDSSSNPGVDAEGYDSIPYETGDPSNRARIIQSNPKLNQGGEIAMTLKLNLPSPCSGTFTDGSFFMWGEAV